MISGVPTVRAWRRRARAARREHHPDAIGERLGDLYSAALFALLYGGILYSEVDRHLSSPVAVEGAAPRHWLAVAALLVAVGLAWRGLRSVGPLFAGPAEQHWVLSSPMSRPAWFTARLAGTLVGGAVGGALAASTVTLLGISSGGIGLAALVGATLGVVLAALSVVAQRADRDRAWPGLPGRILLGGGAALAIAVIVADRRAWPLPAPPEGSGGLLLALAVPLAAVSVWHAVRALPRLDRIRLGAGARLADAVVTATVMHDLTVLTGVLEARRWRRVGRVRSRRLLRSIPGVPDRVWALLQREAVRIARRGGALAVWMGSIVAQYGLAVAAPSLSGVTRLILAYLAAGRMMSGLRTVARSDALRRTLGGSEALVRGVHVVLPGAATLVWWIATVPAGGSGLGPTGMLLMLGIVVAAYRAATRPPLDYDIDWLETPFGPVPLGLVGQIGRGPDVLGAVILVQVLFG